MTCATHLGLTSVSSHLSSRPARNNLRATRRHTQNGEQGQTIDIALRARPFSPAPTPRSRPSSAASHQRHHPPSGIRQRTVCRRAPPSLHYWENGAWIGGDWEKGAWIGGEISRRSAAPDGECGEIPTPFQIGLRFVHLLRGCGHVLRPRDAERDSPVARHDAVFRDTLAALLTRSDHFDQRATATQGDFPSRVLLALIAGQGITIPAKTLSKEYFTYYIILDILLSSIISPDCSTSRRRLGGFSPAHARCGRFGAGSRTSARPTHRAAAGTSRASLATRPIVRPALPPCPPHCCSLPHMRRSCSSASRGASNTSLSVVAAWSAVQQLEVRRDNTINTLWRP